MKKKLIRVVLFGLMLMFAGALVMGGTLLYFSMTLPKISTLAEYKPPAPSQIFSRDGEILAKIGKEKRDVVPLSEVPPIIINSFLAAEDDNFFQHKGVDYWGVLRALIANIKAGKVVQGGSTITQQVAKSLLLSSERSISRKIKDFLLAQRIEEKFSKQDILFFYLNEVYLGGGYYGVKAAFKGYFDKELTEATVAESAMIAGLLVAPGRYSPYINPKYAKRRQAYVLRRLFETNKITEEQYKAALTERIKYRLRKSNFFKAGYFTEWIRQQVLEHIDENDFLTKGYKVTTTLDWELQQNAEKAVMKGLKEIDKRQGYHGPLKSIMDDEIDPFVSEYRKKLYSENSQYFVLNDKFERVYELNYADEEQQILKEEYEKKQSELKLRYFKPGFLDGDPLLDLLQEDQEYQAVVLAVHDWSRLIEVSIAGVPGIIPYEYFRWAHQRKVTDNQNYWGYVTKPSSILKQGDVVDVRVMKKTAKLWENLYSSFSNHKATQPEKEKLKEERYLLCMLEQKVEVEGAVVSLSAHSGEVLSLVGGKDFRISKFNRALQSQRQPGSAFKPLLFAAGLENGFNPATPIIDSPEALGGADSSLNWKPSNYDGQFKGAMTFRESLEQSRNVPTIKMAHQIGVPTIHEFMDRIGFNAVLDKDLSLALGSFGVTLLDIVSTYAIFPNGGKRVLPKSIISVMDQEGNEVALKTTPISVETPDTEPTPTLEPTATPMVLVDVTPTPAPTPNPYLEKLNEEQVYDERLAYIMTNLLRGVVHHGTGKGAKEISLYLGGKTGTTNNYVDAWFVGFSSNIVTGVWTGFDDNTTLGWGETGARSALPIWKGVMQTALKRYGEHDFTPPRGIVNVKIDKKSGELFQLGEGRVPFLEAFVEGTEPGTDNFEENTSSDAASIVEDDYYDMQ